MCPVFFNVFGFPVRSYGVLLIAGFLIALAIAKRRGPAHGLKSEKIWDLAFWLLIFGILGSRLLFILQELPYYSQHPREVLSWRFEGLTSFGGILAGFVTLALWCRKHEIAMRTMLDILGVPFLVAHAVGRIGCLLNGCCYGVETHSALGVHFVGIAGLHHPAQIYDSLMVLASVALIIVIERRRLIPGQSGALTFFFYGLSRFIYEFWRAGSIADVEKGSASSTYWGSLPITQAQALSFLFMIVSIGAYFWLGKQAGIRRGVSAA